MWPMDTPNAPSPTRWSALQSGPEAARAYRRRFLDLEATGEDVHGEARFLTRLVPPPSRVLDAGLRLRAGGEQADPVGAHRDRRRRRRRPDRAGPRGPADPVLRRRPLHPRPAHRAGVRLHRDGGQRGAATSPTGTLPRVLDRLAAHLAPGGYLVSGFGLGGSLPAKAAPSTSGSTTGSRRPPGCRSSRGTRRGTSSPSCRVAPTRCSVHRHLGGP